MTLNEAIAFWIFMALVAGFVVWVIWLARPTVEGDPRTPDRKEDR